MTEEKKVHRLGSESPVMALNREIGEIKNQVKINTENIEKNNKVFKVLNDMGTNLTQINEHLKYRKEKDEEQNKKIDLLIQRDEQDKKEHEDLREQIRAIKDRPSKLLMRVAIFVLSGMGTVFIGLIVAAIWKSFN